MPPKPPACSQSPPHPREKSEQNLKTPRGTTKLICQTCSREFETRASHEERAKYCSMSCRKSAKEVNKMKTALAKADDVRLTPQQSSQIRGQIAKYVSEQINLAHSVVVGAQDWNPTQARVFGMLLNKVVPDLNANFVQHEHNVKQLTELSRSELEAIAQGVATIEVEGDVNESYQ